MKSAHRHELETNALAHKLELYIERMKPYGSWIIGVLVAIVLAILLTSYLAGMSTARSSEAWDTFNQAVTSAPPRIDDLHRAASENPGTPMQQMADITWADSQVFVAARGYLANRTKALELLGKAESIYESVLRSTDNDSLKERAHLGLARVYEMQDKLDKAKDEYGKVTGAFAAYAKAQAERISKPEAQEVYAWLATAQLPLPKAPAGPGTPGQRPEFSPGEMNLPAATGPAAAPPKAEDTKAANDAFDALLKSLKDDAKKSETKEGEKPADGKAETSKEAAPATGKKTDSKPAEKSSK